MTVSIGKRILRLLDPQGERDRMAMREARCITEANAEDLTRTISAKREEIGELMRNYREREIERSRP